MTKRVLVKRNIVVPSAQVGTVGVCPVCGSDTTASRDCVKGYCRRCYTVAYNVIRNKQPDVKSSKAEDHKKWYRSGGSQKALLNRRRSDRQVKLDIIKAYGGKCECCGETAYEFMTIDHIDGDGRLERRTLGEGAQFYRYLRRIGYPRHKYRLLCLNCNFAVGKFGECPHETSRRISRDTEQQRLSYEGETQHMRLDDIRSELEAWGGVK